MIVAMSRSSASDPGRFVLRGIAAARGLRVRALSARHREPVIEFLREHPRRNLLLIDLVAAVGTGAMSPEVFVAWRRGEVVGVASLRPSMALDATLAGEALSALLPELQVAPAGLIKSPFEIVGPVWEGLRASGRSPILDRREIGYAIDAPLEGVGESPPGVRVRRGRESDLDALIFAARASLQEEGRPDPFIGDPDGFRRWVRGRTARARVVECDGQVAFVAYADVRRPEGWLVQGVYTWPSQRRRGLAVRGMAALVAEAFESGTGHVQLSVVEGNAPAIGLYEGLGFRPFCPLRTILFA